MSSSGVTSNLSKSFEQVSNIKKQGTVSDTPAGLLVSQSFNSLAKGFHAGSHNINTGKDFVTITEGGLSTIQDNLQRIRELSVAASNGIYSYEDKLSMQDEIDQLKFGIQDAAKGTEFNTKKLLNQSIADINLATNPDGTSMKIQLDNSTLESLGIADYSILEDYDISDIDVALSKVSKSRSDIITSSNTFDFSFHSNQPTTDKHANAISSLENLDVYQPVSDLKKQYLFEEYRRFAQSAKNKLDDNNE